jgi:hypothetical protein
MSKNNSNSGPSYFLVPSNAWEALLEKEHSHAAMLVYTVLCKHINRESQRCWPSINTISKLSNLHKSNVTRSLNSLCATGMVLRTKNKNSNNAYDQNVYYLPHCIAFEIEYLQSQEITPEISTRLLELQKINTFILESIPKQLGSRTVRHGSRAMRQGNRTMRKGSRTTQDGVVAQSVPNNTTINITNNITKNVSNKETSDNENLPIGLKSINRYDNEFSKVPIEAIGKSNTLLKIKREGLVQQLAEELSDAKSIPFFRSLVSKFTDHEDTIFKCLSLTRETQELAGIKTSRGAVFTDHIKREAEKLGINL